MAPALAYFFGGLGLGLGLLFFGPDGLKLFWMGPLGW